MKLSAYKKGSPKKPAEVSEIRIETDMREIDQLIGYLQNIRDRHSPPLPEKDHYMDWIHFDGSEDMDGCDLIFLTKPETDRTGTTSSEAT